jgi:integrase/recombinase XerD
VDLPGRRDWIRLKPPLKRDYLASFPSPRSRATMRRCIARLVLLTGGDWEAFDRWAILRTIRGLDGLGAGTQRLHVACLRGLLRAAGCTPHVLDAARAPRTTTEPAGRALDREQVERVLAAVRTERDRALVLVLLDGGLRISEAVGLDVVDLVGDVLSVRHGKGRKPRRVVLTARASLAVRACVGTRVDGPLLLTRTGERMAVRGAQRVLDTISRRALVPFTAHDLRRTCVTIAVGAGAALVDVAQHVGHASIDTTCTYLRADPVEQSRSVAAALAR